MGIDYGLIAKAGGIGKGEPRKRTKRRLQRQEAVVEHQVRAECVDRDGYCRFMGAGPCGGPSELVHLEDGRRCHTRGMKPEQRHNTAICCIGCRQHHRRYDAHEFGVFCETASGADGSMRLTGAETITV